MQSDVKPGQVWQHKSTGGTWTVGETQWTQGERKWWGLSRVGSPGTKSVPEWMLLEDYVLVKEAP